jgi:hypothetical protein
MSKKKTYSCVFNATFIASVQADNFPRGETKAAGYDKRQQAPSAVSGGREWPNGEWLGHGQSAHARDEICECLRGGRLRKCWHAQWRACLRKGQPRRSRRR